ncbi:dynamin family protein [Okeania hirsuta]|uniref:Dynamin N-terminal domain-containing protein n=1 Tax=Okeania hirsuta TaxID=1458930 RepID=A0A3N6PE40_9CYAN|nr:dynamin family protein [Okeania hirsuta]RQH08837.1 hypothetical protein D4Z78_28995 [Okeania hirsuta]RQH44552.1 hypothetical protein D5R40_11550 [Okeania hirsuta]
MSTRVQQITAIIEQRQPLANKIEGVKKNLELLSSALNKLENYRDELVDKVDDPKVIGQLKEINTSPIQRNISSELGTLYKLKTRFSRDTLNIAVVGRAGQGKSRLLQSLTGLTAAEIPDGSGQHCTGVRSTIHHNAEFETSGEVWFYTERSFLDEVIMPYYNQLQLGGKPITLNEFASNALPKLPENQKGAVVEAKYEHLRKYHTHLDQYRNLLQESSPRRITRDEIREYVAQDNLAGQRIYHNYLAVKEVKITCNFPNTEVGKIALVDLPGLGDTGIGDEERLINTLSQDIDLVLFVRRPNVGRDFLGDVDVSLYDIARSALVDLPLEKWSFMVFNRTDGNSRLGDNSFLCEQLAADLGNKHINVSESVIADCADPDEANEKILDRVLSYLAANITSLDREYASSCQERLQQIQSTVDAEVEKAKNALGQVRQPADTAQFEVLFEKIWEELTSGLEGLLRDLSKEVDENDRDFEESVNMALQECRDDTGVPSSLEEIQKKRDQEKAYENAYNIYLNEIRAYLSQKFLSLDEGLKRSLDRVKSKVTEVLVEKGCLGNLAESRGAEFIEAIATLIPEQLMEGEPSKLKYGFKILAEFELSYRGFVQHRIRKCLDGLTPDKTTLKISKSASDQEKQMQIMNSLKTLQSEAVYQCQNVLEDLLSEPSQAGFAIVEEFLDRVLRAKGVKIEWRIFLNQERSAVWPEEFELLGERTKLRQDWLAAVESVNQANQLDSMQFIS